MPSIVGKVKINSIGSGGVANFGDLAYVSPKNISKSFSGAGSSVTGDFSQTNSLISVTNTKDTDVLETSQTGNR